MKDSILVVEGEVGEDSYNGGLSMNAQSIMDIPTARARFAQYLRLELNADDEAKISQIKRIISPFRQAEMCPVIVNYENAAGLKARLRFGGDWHVQLDDALLAQLKQLMGKSISWNWYLRNVHEITSTSSFVFLRIVRVAETVA